MRILILGGTGMLGHRLHDVLSDDHDVVSTTRRPMTDLAVDCALRGEPGVIGHDEDQGDQLRAIEFSRIKGGKPFDTTQQWFADLLAGIGQPATRVVAAH